MKTKAQPIFSISQYKHIQMKTQPILLISQYKHIQLRSQTHMNKLDHQSSSLPSTSHQWTHQATATHTNNKPNQWSTLTHHQTDHHFTSTTTNLIPSCSISLSLNPYQSHIPTRSERKPKERERYFDWRERNL